MGCLEGFEVLKVSDRRKSGGRGRWTSLVDQFDAMPDECIGRTFDSHEEAVKVYYSIRSAITWRTYDMGVQIRGCQVFVFKRSDV